MKQASRFHISPRLVATTVVAFLYCATAQAATWQWSAQGGRERLEIQLDPGAQEQTTVRTSPTSVDIRLSAPPASLQREGGAPSGSLVSGLESDAQGIRLSLRDSAFGYVVQRQGNSIVLEVFSDPMGARWRPSDVRTVPAPPQQPLTTAQAAPVQPQVTPPAQAPVQPEVPQTPPATLQQPVPQPPARQPQTPIQEPQIEQPQATPPAPPAQPEAMPGTQAQADPPTQAGQVQGAPEQSSAPAQDDPATFVVPRTSGQQVTPNITIQAEAPAVNIVNMTPTGMPGSAGPGPNGETRITIASGTRLPIQADPPTTALPSNETLSEITRTIESTPARPETVAPVDPLAQALGSTPLLAAEGPQVPSESTLVTIEQDVSALAAGAPIEQEDAPVIIEQSGTGLRARLVDSDAEEWTSEMELSSVGERGSSGIQHVQSELLDDGQRVALQNQAEKTNGEPSSPEQVDVLYVDEHGNPVAPPMDVDAMLAEARQLIRTLQFNAAQELLEQVKAQALPPEKREETLYLLSDAITGQYNGRWLEGYDPIVSSTSEAMNANLASPQVARALERLGMVNLRTGNLRDAEGYFNVLKRKFPYDPQVPESFYQLGYEQMKAGNYAEAVQTFQSVLREFPESPAVRNASRFMAEALYKQGHYERALTIIDFVDRRWPRIYIDDPDYMLMVADTQFRRGRLEDALQTYWIYYNLIPDGPANDRLMLNVGTIYLMQGDMHSARTMYGEMLRRYPESPYAPLAIMRQTEEGIFEGNLTIDDMMAMFGRPNLTTLPEIGYVQLIREYPGTEEAVAAQLRHAAWKLWNREYDAAMDEAEQFIQQHTSGQYTPRADEIILRAFAVELAMDLEEQNYERILSRWERFPQVRGAYANMDDELRVALARAHINRGNEQEGFALLDVFLDRPQDPKFGEYVYRLSLFRAQRDEDWRGIYDLCNKVGAWTFTQDRANERIYYMAMALVNLGQEEDSVNHWRELYRRDDIPLYQKAYANYFMARDAERRHDIQQAYELNKDTLDLFRRLPIEAPAYADAERVRVSLIGLMEVCEVANRFSEALQWADEYEEFVEEHSPDFAGHRFRLARLHRKMGDLARWQYLLEDIVQREPDSVFGQAAASELRTHQVARDLNRFMPAADAQR